MVDFDPVRLAQFPQLTALPMTVIAIWAAIDGIIAKMLSHLMKSDLAIAVAMFHSIKSQDGQRQAVIAAAEKALTLDDYKLLKAVWAVSRASRDRRHEYAHHLWGIPDNIADALALLDPKDSLKVMVLFEERMNAWRKEMRTWTSNATMFLHYHQPQRRLPSTPPSDSPDFSHVKCFRKQDLEDDVADAQRALLWFLDLQRALFDPSQQAKSEAHQRLMKDPRIEQALQPRSSES